MAERIPHYDELELRIAPGPEGAYRVIASGADGSLASGSFLLPFDETQLDNFVLRVGRPRRGMRAYRSSQMEEAKRFGAQLFHALVSGPVRDVYLGARRLAEANDRGLRVTLYLTDVPELMSIPWEFLYERPSFLSQSIYTPLVRSLDLKHVRPPRTVNLPLRILGIVSRPQGLEGLDVEREQAKLADALRPLRTNGLVELHWLERATLSDLDDAISAPDEVHIVHYVGHGAYDARTESGILVLEDEHGGPHEVTGEEIGSLLQDERSLRLVVLNSCEGARASHVDPFSGVGSSLVECGIPAVIGMQFEITDEAAIAFAGRLYGALAQGFPVDAALAQARRAIFAAGNDIEFGTPVLFLRAGDARLFEFGSVPTPPACQELPAGEPEQQSAVPAPGRAAADATSGDWPMPAPLTESPERPFVGRRVAMETLRRGWLRAAAGRPSLRLVSGEPGIGKTRLASAFAHEVQLDGAAVLYGRCDEDPLVSYQPFVEAMRQVVAHRPGLEDELDPRFEPELVELGRLVPELRRRARPGVSATPAFGAPERYLLFEAVVALLRAAAGRRPLLLVLDDLQWADTPTALLLRHVLRAGTGKIMVLGTTRKSEPRADHPVDGVLADLRRERGDEDRLERLALGGLDEIETAALVNVGEERSVDAGFVRLLHEETAGNPFFIEEMLRGLRERDGARLPAAGDAASVLRSIGVPDRANEVIERRVVRLSREARELLTHASVCGREFRVDVVAELLGQPVAQVMRPLEEAMAAGLVVEPIVNRFSFCHALVREALYRRITSDGHRARVHRAVGEALEHVGPARAPASELALHFHAARAVGGAEKAVRYALAAAEVAAKALAYEEAASHTAKALDALEALGPDHDAQRCRVFHSLGRLQWQAGDRTTAQLTFLRQADFARRLGDSNQLARAALGFGGRWYDAENVDPVLIDLLEEALAALPPGDGPVRAELMARLADALHFTDPLGRAMQLSSAAVEMARRTGDADALLAVLGPRHSVLLHAAHLRDRLDLTSNWLKLAENFHRDEKVALALNWRIYDLLELGDGDRARCESRRLAELADRLRQPQYQNHAASWEYNWLAIAGRFAEAEHKAAESYRYAQRAQTTYAKTLFAGQLYGLRRDQGRLGEISALVAPLVGAKPTLAVWRAGMVLAHLDAGNRTRARAELSALARDGFSAIPADVFWLGAMCLLAEGCVALGDEAVASDLVPRLEPYADLNALIQLAVFVGPVHRFLGMLARQLGNSADAEAHFVAALKRCFALGALTVEAHTQCDYGELLLERGDAGARALLERSHATAKRLGMPPLVRRASRALEEAVTTRCSGAGRLSPDE